MKNSKPKFGFECMWCLKCIYDCPRKALSPRILKFVVLKNGFNIKAMSKMAHQAKQEAAYKPSQNVLWSGIIKYLNK